MKGFRVAILFNLMFFTEFDITSEGKEFGSLSYTCQWGPVRNPSRNSCTERCHRFKGFIIPGTTQLVCFQDSKKSSLIPLKDEEENTKQCGYKTPRTASRACNPSIICEYATEEQCLKKCDEYNVYLSKVKSYLEISHCGKTSQIEQRITNLDATGHYYYIEREDGIENKIFNCSCGIGEEGTDMREPKNKRQRRWIPNEDSPGEMVASCPNVLLSINKIKCQEGCENSKCIFSRNNNQFICFNTQRNVTKMFESGAGYCECGVPSRKARNNGKCPPDRKIPLNNTAEGFDCAKECANYQGYLFTPKQVEPYTVYCELPSYIFKNLSYEVGKIVVDYNKDGSKKYRKYECTCGLRLSQSEINSKINTFLITNGRNEVRSNLQTLNHSETRNAEKEISDMPFPAALDIIENEEFDDLVNDSGFLYDLINNDKNLLSNNDSDIPIIGNQRPSHKMSLRDVDKINREIDEILEPADIEISLMSCHHISSPNNTNIASLSSSQNAGFDRDIILNEKHMFQRVFAETKNRSPSIRDKYFASPRLSDPDFAFELFETLPPGVVDPHPMFFHHSYSNLRDNYNKEERLNNSDKMRLTRDMSPNMGITELNVSQNGRGLIRNNSTQNMGVLNRNARRRSNNNEISSQSISAGPICPPIWDVDNISGRRSLSKSPSFLFPKTTTEINEMINPAGDIIYGNLTSRRNMRLNGNTSTDTEVGLGASQDGLLIPNVTSQNTGYIGNITSNYLGLVGNTSPNNIVVRNMSPNAGVGPGGSQNEGLIRNYTSPNIGVFDPNTMPSNDPNVLRDISVGTKYQSLRFEDDISRGSFSDWMSFFLRNEPTEMNEVMEQPADFDQPPIISRHQQPFLHNIIDNNHEESASFQNMEYSGDMLQNRGVGSSESQNIGLISNTPRNVGLKDREMMSIICDNTLGYMPAGTRYPSFQDEDISRRTFSDPINWMEENEILRPVGDIDLPPMFCQH